MCLSTSLFIPFDYSTRRRGSRRVWPLQSSPCFRHRGLVWLWSRGDFCPAWLTQPYGYCARVRLGLPHEAVFSKQERACNGANPPPVPVSKTKKPLKATFRLRPCLISLQPKALGKAEYSHKWPQAVTRNSNNPFISDYFNLRQHV